MDPKMELIKLNLRSEITRLNDLSYRTSDNDIRPKLRNISAKLTIILLALSTQTPAGRPTINGA